MTNLIGQNFSVASIEAEKKFYRIGSWVRCIRVFISILFLARRCKQYTELLQTCSLEASCSGLTCRADPRYCPPPVAATDADWTLPVRSKIQSKNDSRRGIFTAHKNRMIPYYGFCWRDALLILNKVLKSFLATKFEKSEKRTFWEKLSNHLNNKLQALQYKLVEHSRNFNDDFILPRPSCHWLSGSGNINSFRGLPTYYEL